ncbi:hypothetical protein CKK33_07130 [Mucilaginibacter sp. MD40]|uniref:TlpA disulfide reductase family protein n=1 Tax=Mucilaginibacter sp. MD40 TaxID=2029590 RepID=UPI000BACC58C|nr:TlpA disulfide reductase family protein [Mucilaginibacter sp. MD40]PAW93283.1 hypothetical protein CKK33_07130 [Mucilaginibacter sp. MD40]
MTKKLILLTLGLLPASLMAQQKFTITGYVKGLKNADKVYLIHVNNAGEFTSDSSTVNNGKFGFSGTIQHPVLAYLYRNINPLANKPQPGEKIDAIDFYVESGKLSFTSNDSLKSAIINGSPINAIILEWKAMQKPIEDKIKVLDAEFNNLSEAQRNDEKTIPKIIAKETQYENEIKATGILLAEHHPNSYISLVALRQAAGIPLLNKRVASALDKLSPQLKNSETARKIKLIMAATLINKIGDVASDFTQNTPQGKPIKLSDFKGKYVLIDFWASWCGPCREENPNVLNAYNKYKDKNFTVLGVSLDKHPDAWVKAIADDHLPWTQVSDLKGGDNLAALQYSVRNIPSNVLIGPDGKIIAKNLMEEHLGEKLAELFGTGSK